MRKTVFFIQTKLALALLLSSILGTPAHAHEVTPAIADLSTAETTVTLRLRLNAEALLAEIDLDGLEDTNEAEGAAQYDSLRALPPAALETRLRRSWDRLGQGLSLSMNGTDLPLAPDTIQIPEVGNPDLPRASILTLTADLPPQDGDLVLSWPRGFGTLILRQQGVEAPYTGTLSGGDSSPPIPVVGGRQISAWQAFGQYIPVGFDHILPKGLDHILFVLGLYFLSTHIKPLLWQVSAFTLAHTVTLALGAMGWVSIPASIVEPLIAASITFVAIENIFAHGLNPWRPIIIFCFGLLHGLGFASVLGQFGLPEDQFFPALIGFNVGVELGQITVIALAFLAVGAWFRNKPWYRARIAIPASTVIALVGGWWFIERVFL
ncbi:HupE/UreJ family protein [Thalassovita taeanensis]|uniref:HupE / UreJ protein n=1 Tax=Thalassovita taeanensis TaxID=657014 RepID=A0A1H8Z4L2_9RHOB|nr:HupE/UreJ family protein [Thalassovita taeanensis]SEP59326.1 HupE / UreJ protein [Thalassovita taeanensis]